MEWRQQTSVSCAHAFNEAQRWIQEVTGKLFGCSDFRAALEDGVLLCDLINQLKPGIIKRVNRLSTPIAGLDNVNVFLKACGKLGLNESQLFHPGDLQDLSTRVTLRRDESSRRLKNVLITIYWLGRKAHLDAFYSGPQLNFKAFEGLLGLALSKSLDESSNVFVKDGGYRECWYPEREERQRMRRSYKRENSVDSVDSLDSRALRPNSEGCGSDAEAEQVFRMETSQPPVHQTKGHIPPPLLRRKQRREENGSGCDGPLTREYHNRVRPERPVQVRPETPVQVNPGWIWSKSLSDIPMFYPVRKLPKQNTIHDVGLDADTAEEWQQEHAETSGVPGKESEAQWQDDLTKWKNRRRSSNTDHRRKSLDREHVINACSLSMTNGAVSNFKNDTQRGAMLKRDQPPSPRRSNPAPRLHSTAPLSKSTNSDLRPHTRALLSRSYATEAPYSPRVTLITYNSAHTQGSLVGAMPASDGTILGEETHFPSLASEGAGATTPSVDFPFSSQTQVKAQGRPAPLQPTSEPAQPQNVPINKISTLVTTLQPKEATKSTCTASTLNHKELPPSIDPAVPTVFPAPVNQTSLEDMSHRSQEESLKTTWEPAEKTAGVYKYLSRTVSWSGSASLPRGYRRSEGSSRLSSAITARPFGTKQSRMSSLPRLCSVDGNGLQLNSEKEKCLSPPTKSSLKRQTAASHLRTSLRLKKPSQMKQSGTDQVVVEEEEEGAGGSIVSTQSSLKTNGFHHQPCTQTQPLPQPNSTLQAQHYNSSTLPTSTKVDHSNMRVSLTLKPNSVPDFGLQTHWDSTGARVKFIQLGSPAELCQLCVDDEIVAVDGVAVAHMNYNQWKDKITSALQSGNLTMDIRRYGNKDWSSSEGSHHNQPGKSRMTLNLTAAAPLLIGCPDHHANSTASTETAALKFNGHTDNVKQGKVLDGGSAEGHRTAKSKDVNKLIRNNQKRRAEFFKQRGGSESAISDLQVPSLSPSSSSWSWDREEDQRRQEKWQEEQERLLQEQYQRDQERLKAEWRRAQQDAMGDLCRKSVQTTFQMTNGGAGPARTQLHVNAPSNRAAGEEQSPDGDERKESGRQPQSDARGEQSDAVAEQDWAVESCGFAQLSTAHRAKSLSSPALAGSHKQTRGDQRKRKGQSLSKSEQDRQQILEEMKKRTQLLTDNSWIRQRRSSLNKEPVYGMVPLKRYESLDDLDSLRHSPVSSGTFGFPRPHSAAGYCAPSRNCSSRYSTGAILSRKYVSMDPAHHGSVWAAADISEELKLESRFEPETVSPTVSYDQVQYPAASFI
ncbi:LIM domain only protein 7-like isoform X2 [Hippoglossus stenolepis]|uniref:LIM domain only protein 7-like isoform X2 n=1 Tax=Hippoglossus stenolepis TaxID=195615 RepID=UPI001FAF9508|nr:LIM domain only protein 7-like isoform X2 [Hippoglossus stenolepis]